MWGGFGAVAIANTIAYVSEAIDPISIFIGLTTTRHMMAQAVRYLFFGEGETRTYCLHHPDCAIGTGRLRKDVRPRIFLMSD
jgi:hypothetical protein